MARLQIALNKLSDLNACHLVLNHSYHQVVIETCSYTFHCEEVIRYLFAHC